MPFLQPRPILLQFALAGIVCCACGSTSDAQAATSAEPRSTHASAAATQPAVSFVRSPRRIVLQDAEVRIPMEPAAGMPGIPVLAYQAADGSHRRLLLDTGSDSTVF